MATDHYPEAERTGRDKEVSIERRKRAVSFFGHWEYGKHTLARWRWPCENRTYITMLRHPLERALSQFWYAVKYNPESGIIPKGKGIMWYSWGRGDLMTQCIGGGYPPDIDKALANLHKFDCVGIVAEFDRSIQLYAKELGWDVGELENQNVSAIKPKDAKKRLTEKEITKVLEYNSKDVMLYKEAVKLFHKQCERAEI